MTELWHRYEVQTHYGYYPDGTWGFACYRADQEEAIQFAQEGTDYRVLDRATNRVIWPTLDEQDGQVNA